MNAGYLHSTEDQVHVESPDKGEGGHVGQHPFLTEVLNMMGTALNYGRDEEIFGEGEPSDYIYLVLKGSVRTYKLMADGRRQIAAFCLPGDIFGMEACDSHAFTAEAVEKSRIVVTKRSAVLSLAQRDGAFAGEMWQATAADLTRAQAQLLLLGRKNAQERVATFLLEMSERTCSERSILLPMSRQDIADYLGLTIETVSRTISHLEHAATIALPKSRQIELRDRGTLAALNT
ncbi:MAG: helix-turn-helix domain-containing protein [Alphaproteobacteria bacterium]